jgi:hypothetical protein
MDPIDSKTLAPHQFSMIPFPVKALKLLLNELHSDGDAAAITAQDAAGIDSDDGVR